MADSNHYAELAAGLQQAADAAKACAQEESGEDDPKNLKDAASKTRRLFAKARDKNDKSRGSSQSSDDGGEY